MSKRLNIIPTYVFFLCGLGTSPVFFDNDDISRLEDEQLNVIIPSLLRVTTPEIRKNNLNVSVQGAETLKSCLSVSFHGAKCINKSNALSSLLQLPLPLALLIHLN